MKWTSARVLSTTVASCGGSDGIGGQGEQLFASAVLGGPAGCVTFHSLEPDRVVVGPSLAGVGRRAASGMPGQSAGENLRASMRDSCVVAGFGPGRMPSNWEDVLTDAEIDARVAYSEGL